MSKLKVQIPWHTGGEFKIWSGDEDITDKLAIRSIEVQLKGGADEMTTCVMEVYADEIIAEIMPENVTINMIAQRSDGSPYPRGEGEGE